MGQPARKTEAPPRPAPGRRGWRGAMVQAFERTLDDLDAGSLRLEPARAEELGRRAALLASAEAVWARAVGPVLSTAEVQTVLGVSTRQAVSDRVRRGRLLALESGSGRLSYPAFQFLDGGTLPGLPLVLREFADARVSPHTVAAWFLEPRSLLGGESPAAWLRQGKDPLQAIRAARRTAARLRS